MDVVKFMKSAIAGIEDLDHKVLVVNADEAIPENILAQMEADGYEFYCSPAAENGKREIYFTRERPPVPRM